MRRALRWFFAVTGTLVCLTAAALWVRSYTQGVHLTYRTEPGAMRYQDWIVSFDRGRLIVAHYRWNHPIALSPGFGRPVPFVRTFTPSAQPYYYETVFDCLGFVISAEQDNGSPGVGLVGRCVVVPLWFVVLLSALTALFAVRPIRLARARRCQNACKSCGYDLRAGHDKCPECGGESHVQVGAGDSARTPSAPTVQR